LLTTVLKESTVLGKNKSKRAKKTGEGKGVEKEEKTGESKIDEKKERKRSK
jgi:hypothetical protein